MNRFIHLFSQKYYQIFHRKAQSGRSMIEMLGVLIVIGVLSIAALSGFSYAMNRHKANETIHDVMLRATNVPMIDEHYVERVGDYEWKFAGLPEDGQLGSFYRMHTVVSDLNEYIYRVVVSDVPKRVCRQVLSLNPTDIDAIYVEGDKPSDEECPNELNTMAFYFDEYGTGGHLPDIDNPNPEEPGSDTPVPPLPEPGEDCLSRTSYRYGDNCEYTGECCLNPLAEGCPPSCTPKGCPEAPTCGACEQYTYDGNGCANGCEQKTCTTSCSEGEEATGYDECGCVEGCVKKCPTMPTCGACEVPNYNTCSCEYDTSCCPEFSGCSACETEVKDEKGCSIGCEQGPDYAECFCSGSENPYCCMNPQEESCVDYCVKCGDCCVADPCPDDESTDPVCCALLTEGGFWARDRCCLDASEGSACCEAKGGEWCNGDTCCQGDTTCANGVCCPNPIVEDCPDPCTYMDVDESGCPACIPVDCPEGQTCNSETGSCEGKCSEDEPIFCSIGEETWCCAEGSTCGSTSGQCCIDGNCCNGTLYSRKGSFSYVLIASDNFKDTQGCKDWEEKASSTQYYCCPEGQELKALTNVWIYDGHPCGSRKLTQTIYKCCSGSVTTTQSCYGGYEPPCGSDDLLLETYQTCY